MGSQKGQGVFADGVNGFAQKWKERKENPLEFKDVETLQLAMWRVPDLEGSPTVTPSLMDSPPWLQPQSPVWAQG